MFFLIVPLVVFTDVMVWVASLAVGGGKSLDSSLGLLRHHPRSVVGVGSKDPSTWTLLMLEQGCGLAHLAGMQVLTPYLDFPHIPQWERGGGYLTIAWLDWQSRLLTQPC